MLSLSIRSESGIVFLINDAGKNFKLEVVGGFLLFLSVFFPVQEMISICPRVFFRIFEQLMHVSRIGGVYGSSFVENVLHFPVYNGDLQMLLIAQPYDPLLLLVQFYERQEQF